jgi:uncharacterized protein (TIGR00251 family)
MMISPRGDGSALRVRVVTGAGRAGVVGPHGDELKVRVCSPPVEGRANDELCAVLADALGVHVRDVRIVGGATSRSKLLIVPLPPDLVADRLRT